MKKQKNLSVQILALVMTILILTISFPISVFADFSQEETKDTNIETDVDTVVDSTKEDVFVLEENKALREENVKHFKLSDGTTRAVIYAQAVHYKDNDGKWIDIDNSLTLNGSEYSTNNKSNIKFANKSDSNGLISIKEGDYKIEFTPLNTNKVGVVIENPQENNSRKFEDISKLNSMVSKAVYEDIYDGIDVEYILVGNNIKENIIVKEMQEEYTFSFELKLNKLSAELANGAIILSDFDSGEKIYEIPAPYMYDSSNVYSQNVEYSLVQNSKWKYTFTVTADSEWINAENRDFPVIIDPTIIDNTNIIDRYVTADNDENPQYDESSSNQLIVGNFMGGLDVPTFIKFNDIENIVPQTAILVKTDMVLHCSYVFGAESQTLFGIYEATSDWTQTLTYAGSRTFYDEEEPLDSILVPANANEIRWNVTSAYKNWIEDSSSNHGLCIRAIDLDSDVGASLFMYSSEVSYFLPSLEITYIDTLGIEWYNGVVSSTLGDLGTGYVNLYNGELTYVQELTTIESHNYDISLIYNSATNDWRYSFQENITPLNHDGFERYIWQDSDGTSHCFSPYMQKNLWGEYIYYEVANLDEDGDPILQYTNNPTVFYPEDDLDYVLKETENGEFILQDYEGNQKLFDDDGRLIKICDNLGNVLHINHHTDGSLASIYTKDSDGEIVFLLEMYYWTNGKLIRIHDNQNQRQIRFGWTGDNMTSVRYHNMNVQNAYKVVRFEYENDTNNLLSIFDNDVNKKIKYYTETNDEDNSTDDENIVELLNVNGSIEQTTKKYIVGEYFYKDLGNDFESDDDDLITVFTFDNKGRKSSVATEGNTITLSYDESAVPDASYYEVEYNQNIYNEGFNIVKYNVETEETEFLDLNVQEISNTNIIETTQTPIAYDTVDNTEAEPYNMVCQILAYYDGRNDPFQSTGFLCGPDTIIMSGHAIREEIGGNDIFDFGFPSRIEVIPGKYIDNDGTSQAPFGIYEVTTIYIAKEYYYVLDEENMSSTEYDWAVCVLDKNIDEQLQYFDIMVAPDDISTQYIEIIGYIDSTMYWSRGQIEGCTKRTIHYNVATNNGISGSPIFFNNGDYTVFGIHTVSEPNRGGTRINSLIYNLVEFLNE